MHAGGRRWWKKLVGQAGLRQRWRCVQAREVDDLRVQPCTTSAAPVGTWVVTKVDIEDLLETDREHRLQDLTAPSAEHKSGFSMWFYCSRVVGVYYAPMAKPTPSAEEQIFQRDLGRRVAIMRERKQLSQMDLSRVLGRDRSTITRLEKGTLTPSPYMLTRIATALDVHVMHLLGDVDLPPVDEWVDRVESRR